MNLSLRLLVITNVIVWLFVSSGCLGNTEGECSSNDEGCFSFTFTSVEELRRDMLKNEELREYLRRKLASEMKLTDDFGDNETPCNDDHKVATTTGDSKDENGDEMTVSRTSSTTSSELVTTPQKATTSKSMICSTKESDETWKNINGHCFHTGTELVPYTMAKANCNTTGGRLASAGIRNETIVENLRKTSGYTGQYWIGLDKMNNTTWSWSDNADYNMSETNWGEDQPGDKTEGEEICGGLIALKIHDFPCSNEKRYICEMV